MYLRSDYMWSVQKSLWLHDPSNYVALGNNKVAVRINDNFEMEIKSQKYFTIYVGIRLVPELMSWVDSVREFNLWQVGRLWIKNRPREYRQCLSHMTWWMYQLGIFLIRKDGQFWQIQRHVVKSLHMT